MRLRWRSTGRWDTGSPGDAVKNDVALQLCRAARSIPANIAEGVNQTNSTVETKRFLGMASRSCDEVRVWLSFCRDLSLLPAATAGQWEQEYAEIGAMLYRLWQNWRRLDSGASGE